MLFLIFHYLNILPGVMFSFPLLMPLFYLNGPKQCKLMTKPSSSNCQSLTMHFALRGLLKNLYSSPLVPNILPCFNSNLEILGYLWLTIGSDVNILSLLHLETNYITFHSFRRSGAAFAFNHNVSIQEIQKHGTWMSDCVWRYVSDSTDAGSQVASTFATLLS